MQRERVTQNVGQLQGTAARVGSSLPQRGSSREALDNLSGTQAEGIARAYEHLVARHLGGVGKEEERTRYQCDVEDIHTRTAEYLFGKDDGKGRSHGNHPQRGVDRHNHGDEHTRYQEALLDFVVTQLCGGKLDAQTHHIRYHDFGQHGQESEEEDRPERRLCQLAYGQVVLIAHIVHTEEQGRQQGDDNDRHRPFRVYAVVNVYSRTRGGVGNKQE